MNESAEALREGFKQYLLDNQIANGRDELERVQVRQRMIQKGQSITHLSPASVQPSFIDFQYWVWKSGRYQDLESTSTGKPTDGLVEG